jgi:uncharacterized spore protein YtfJ
MQSAESKRSVEALASNPAEGVIERLGEKLGVTARAAAVFGEPVEREGVTVIPVARVRWGFGGGAGRKDGENAGGGGGGGVQASPIGFIELRGGTAEFRRIRTGNVPWIAGFVAGFLLVRRLYRRG